MHIRRTATVLGLAGLMVLPATAAHADGPSDQDVAYLRAAHQVNLAEIEGSRIAWGKTADPRLKELAVTFIRDHVRMDVEVTKTARRLRVPLPQQPNPEQQALAGRYRAASAETFDEYFISTQLVAHRQSMNLTESQIAVGKDASVKRLAERAAPVIAGHHAELREAAVVAGLAGYLTGSARP